MIYKLLKGGRKCTLLIGSGVSIFPPEDGTPGLPNGQSVVSTLMDHLFNDVAHNFEDKSKFGKIINETPFEQAFRHHPKIADVQNAISEFYSTSKFNSIHKSIARLVQENLVDSIITTNYDRCLENAMKHLAIQPINPIVFESDTHKEGLKVFKIHGSSGSPASIVLSLDQECILPSWKQLLFKEIVNQKTIVVLGYSGRDFDVCPFLLSSAISPYSIYWIEPSNNLSSNLQLAVSRDIAKHCEVRFHGLFDDKALLDLETCAPSPEPLVQKILLNLTTRERREWQLGLLDVLSLPTYLESVINDTSHEMEISLINISHWRAEQAECEGRYFDSIKFLRRSILFLLLQKDWLKATTSLQSITGRYYSAGAPFRFIFSLIFLSAFSISNRYSLRAGCQYLWGLLFRRLTAVLTHMHNQFLSQMSRRMAVVFLNTSAKHFYEVGDWHHVYLCQAQLLQLGCNLRVGAEGELHSFLHASSGFENLNSLVGRVTGLRHEKPEIFKGSVETTYETVLELERLKLFPEIWKIASECYDNRWISSPEKAEQILRMGEFFLDTSQISKRYRRRIHTAIERNMRQLKDQLS